MSGYLNLTYKYTENRNHAKSAMISEFLYNIRTILNNRSTSMGAPVEVIGSIPMGEILLNTNLHVENFYEWDGESRTTPCMNHDCAWIEYFCIFYASSELPLWPLPADPEHPMGHCKVCQGLASGDIRRRNIKVVGVNKIKID